MPVNIEDERHVNKYCMISVKFENRLPNITTKPHRKLKI
jgi:hypothetical protein